MLLEGTKMDASVIDNNQSSKKKAPCEGTVRSKKRLTKKRLWTCDVCRVQKFEDYEQACRHEQQCRKNSLLNTSSQQASKEEVVNLEETDKEVKDSNAMELTERSGSRKKRKSEEGQPLVLSPSSDDSDVIVEKFVEPERPQEDKEVSSNPNPSVSKRIMRERTHTASEVTNNWLTTVNVSKTSKKSSSTRPLRKTGAENMNNNKTRTTRTSMRENGVKSVNDLLQQPPAKMSTKHGAARTNGVHKPSRKTGTKAKTKNTAQQSQKDHPSCIHFFGGMGISKELLAEHRAAELQAKRLAQQQKDRERRVKKEQEGQKRSNAFTNGTPQASAAETIKPFPVPPRPIDPPSSLVRTFDKKKEPKQQLKKTLGSKMKNAAPRFPNPSHVFPQCPSDVIIVPTSVTQDYTGSHRQQTNASVLGHFQRKLAFSPLSPTGDTSWSRQVADHTDPVSDIMARLIASAQSKQSAEQSHRCDDGTLLVDKHCISDRDLEEGFVGETLNTAANELRSFIENWKVQRHKANQRMAERQRRLVEARNKRIKRRNKTKVNDVEDLWMGDDGDQLEDSTLCTLMLLTGPVASGKTSLVHAVTQLCDCKVIEINTSEKRSGAKLKQLLQEATQSHSSVDLLKRNRLQTMLSEQLVDSEDEEQEDGDAKPRGDSLAVILIDEVDLLYDEDIGFWSAIADLTKSKRAKCPIVLTANSIPDQLRSFRYEHIELERPSLAESVHRMQHILQVEGMDHAVDQELLEACATLLNRDLRRFCNEMQSYLDDQAHAISMPQSVLPRIVGLPPDCPPHFNETTHDSKMAVVESVKPASIAALEYSLLTLSGTGFLSLASSRRSDNVGFDVHVYIDGFQSPVAVVLDDETILVVHAPRVEHPILNSSDSEVLFDDDTDDDDRYCVPIVVSSVRKLGIVSTTEGSLRTQQLGDGTRWASTEKPVFINLRFPKKIGKHSSQLPNSEETVERLLQEGVDAWKSRNSNQVEPQSNTVTPEDDLSIAGMMEADRRARLASDAAALESCMNMSMPYLAGACRGLGLEMTEGPNVHSTEKSEAISERKLFDLGWKDDCFFYGTSDAFVSYPTTCRERKLVNLVQQTERGRPGTLTFSEREQENSYEQEDWSPPELSEQDCFLPGNCAPSLLALPSYLFSLSNALPAWTCLDAEQQVHYSNWARLFDEIFFFVTLSRDQLFARGIGRAIDNVPIEAAERFDTRIVLDYVPILRRMAVHEAAAERYVKSLGGEATATSSFPMRATRRRKPELRYHYFKYGAFADYFDRRGKDLVDVNEVTYLLCSRALGVQTAPLEDRTVAQEESST